MPCICVPPQVSLERTGWPVRAVSGPTDSIMNSQHLPWTPFGSLWIPTRVRAPGVQLLGERGATRNAGVSSPLTHALLVPSAANYKQVQRQAYWGFQDGGVRAFSSVQAFWKHRLHIPRVKHETQRLRFCSDKHNFLASRKEEVLTPPAGDRGTPHWVKFTRISGADAVNRSQVFPFQKADNKLPLQQSSWIGKTNTLLAWKCVNLCAKLRIQGTVCTHSHVTQLREL